jgi:hypothetical protein
MFFIFFVDDGIASALSFAGSVVDLLIGMSSVTVPFCMQMFHMPRLPLIWMLGGVKFVLAGSQLDMRRLTLRG